MSTSSPFDDDSDYYEQPKQPDKKAWFASNSGGVGLHPQRWQGWAVLAVAVVIVAIVIILLKHAAGA